jgi:type II secretory pathway component GspD/PulD (secretin)
MMRHQHFSCGGLSRIFAHVLVVILFLRCGYILAADQGDASGPIDVKGFSLKHISAQQGKKLLAELKLGTVSQLPGTNMLLVTGRPRELSKAVVLLELADVDAKEECVIKPILPALEAKDLPSKDQIAGVIGNVSLGDFVHPPRTDAGARGIIDVHNDMVLVIAPASLVEKIVLAIDQLQNPQPPPTPQGQPTAQPVEPKEPNAVGWVPEQMIRELLAGADVKAKPEANEVSVEPAPEPQLEPAPGPGPAPSPKIEQKVVKAEQPSEIAEPNTAVSTYRLEPIPNGQQTLSLDLPDNVDIIMLLGLAGRYLGLDFMYDPNEIKGGVTLKLQGKLKGPIKVRELYPLLESALKFRGFVMTRKDNLVTIVPKERALEIDPTLQANGEKIQAVRPGDVVITRIFELKHIDTASAENLLSGMRLGESVSSIPEAKTLIVTEYAYRMPRIDQLLQMIDKPGDPKKFSFRQLKYTMARTLAEKVKTLAEQLGTVSVTVPEMLEAGEYTPSPRRAGETDAVYNLRIARERAQWTALRQRAAPQPGQPRAPQPEPAKPTVYLDADERTNRILMIGVQEQLKEVEELIDALDVEQQDLRTLQLYKIEHVGAEEVKTKLQELGLISPTPTTTSQRITGTGPRQAAPPVPGQSTPTMPTTTTTTETKEPLVEEPQVVVIEQTNSLLVNATAEQHTRIATIINYVDSQVEASTIPYVVYPLENQDPNNLAAVLEKLITETTTKEDKEAKIVTTEKTARRKEEEIVIVADGKTYSLIVYASKEDQQWIGNLIKQLDEYRPQVLLDVTLVEITKNEEFSLDLDLVRKWPRLEPGATMQGPGLSALLSPFPEERIVEAVSTAAGGAKAFYADRHVQALLEAVQQKGYGRILARPKLLVNDNEEGIIKSEEETSIVKEETQIIPGTATTAPTATTQVGFETRTAGITLTITPHISKGNQLQLMVNLNRTDFRLRPNYEITSGGEKKSGPTPPDLLSSDVTSKVTVPDGTTIILGGLETLKQSKGGTKVPILGDVPLIGGLFRSVANRDAQSRLYVFVKAHILRPGEELAAKSDIEVVSRNNQQRFEKYEDEMQKYQDWPGIKPKPMDPPKVLEAD